MNTQVNQEALNIDIPECLLFLIEEKIRFKVLYGGRGGGKSHGVVRALIACALTEKQKIWCARQTSNSINTSVYTLFTDVLSEYHLLQDCYLTVDLIRFKNGSEFHFKGIQGNNTPEQIDNLIKAHDNFDKVWIEEATHITDRVWLVLLPTMRKEGSEIWVTFNPYLKQQATYQRFVVNMRSNMKTVLINYYDNPFISKVLLEEARFAKTQNYEEYCHIWLGQVKEASDAQIFKNWEVTEFEAPMKSLMVGARFFYGVDWGAVNATVMIRCFMKVNPLNRHEKYLYIDHEAYIADRKVTINMMDEAFLKIPGVKENLIYIDTGGGGSMLITDFKKLGYRMEFAKKPKDSIIGGIHEIQSFSKVYIHPRCKYTIDNFLQYSWKTDKNTQKIIDEEPEDANNDCIDALRYALTDYIIKSSGTASYLIRKS